MTVYFAGDGWHEVAYNNGARSFLLSPAVNKPQFIREFKDKYPGSRVMLDSGAFSFKNKGQSPSAEVWLDMCGHLMSYVDEVVSLDIIGDHRGSLENYLHIKKHHPQAIPTFHVGGPIEILDEYVRHTDRVALGGLSKSNNKVCEEHLRTVFSKHQRLRLHAFALTRHRLLATFPIYSTDSTSWQRRSYFGGTSQYSLGRVAVSRRPKSEAEARVLDVIPVNDPIRRMGMSVLACLSEERYLTRLWEKRGVTWS